MPFGMALALSSRMNNTADDLSKKGLALCCVAATFSTMQKTQQTTGLKNWSLHCVTRNGTAIQLGRTAAFSNAGAVGVAETKRDLQKIAKSAKCFAIDVSHETA
jgi:hypothetical protein